MTISNFDVLTSFNDLISCGNLTGNAADVQCLLYQIAIEDIPSSLSGVLWLPAEVIAWAHGKLGPVFAKTGYPTEPTKKM